MADYICRFAMWFKTVCSSQNPNCAMGLQRSCTRCNNDFLLLFHLQMYANPLDTLYLCNFRSKRKCPLCCILDCIVCPTFPPHQLGMLEHSALAHSVWQRHVSGARFCEPPCQLRFLGPQSNAEGRGPSLSKLTARSGVWSTPCPHVFLTLELMRMPQDSS